MIGAGAIGGVLAAAAHDAGHDVRLCVRTPFEKLRLDAPEGPSDVPVEILSDPDSVSEVDWVLLTTKVQDVDSTAPWLRRLAGENTPVVIIQNGIEHRDSVSSLELAAPLLPALIYVGAERVRPGHIVRRSPTSMIVPTGDLGDRFIRMLSTSGVTTSSTEDFHTAAWRKLLTNLAANPITALTLRRLDVFAEPDIRELASGVLDESVAVARAEGADIGTADAEKVLASFTGHFSADTGTSMLYDRLAGASTEHEHITGALVRAGERHGIALPLNRTLLTLMRALRPVA
ncbi:2-dehydropantoate 2-reductase [Parasphingorhabdus pacifica]